MWKIISHIEIYNYNGSLWWPLAHPTPLLCLLLITAQLPLPCRTALANGNLLIQKVLPPPTPRGQPTASEELIPGGKGQPACLRCDLCSRVLSESGQYFTHNYIIRGLLPLHLLFYSLIHGFLLRALPQYSCCTQVPQTLLLGNLPYDVNPLEYALFLGCHEAQN